MFYFFLVHLRGGQIPDTSNLNHITRNEFL